MEWEQNRSNRRTSTSPRIIFLQEGTYEADFARVQPRLCGKPFPHEGTGGTVVHRANEALDIIVH